MSVEISSPVETGDLKKFQFRCPHCGAAYVNEAKALVYVDGVEFECEKCGKPFRASANELLPEPPAQKKVPAPLPPESRSAGIVERRREWSEEERLREAARDCTLFGSWSFIAVPFCGIIAAVLSANEQTAGAYSVASVAAGFFVLGAYLKIKAQLIYIRAGLERLNK